MLLNIKRCIYKKLISRATFKKWLEFEDIRSRIKDAADQSENEKVSDLLCSYLSAALCRGKWDKLPWEAVLNDYAFVVNLHTPSKDFRIFSTKMENSEFRINDSSWYAWSSIMAKSYGWSLEYIAELSIDDAISLIQETLYDMQLEREWEWALSEKSVHYDSKTKTSKFRGLDRPEWMQEKKKPIEVPKTKIRADMIPPGIIIRWNEPDVEH